MLSYRIGDRERPRGHALLYFHDADDAATVWATYLVVPPIELDLGKYVPAAFASQFGGQLPAAGQGNVAYPLPPMPEKVEGGLPALERMANLRGDDLLDGGTIRMADPWQAMQPIAQFGQEYAEKVAAYLASAPVAEIGGRGEEPPRLGVGAGRAEGDEASGAGMGGRPSGTPMDDVDDLLLQVMPDRERIGRVARLLGPLRYAVEGGDERSADEAVADMERVGRHLADKYRVGDLIAAARLTDARGGQLAQLYVDRCYRLADEDYGAVPALERQIEELRAGLA